jgi:CHAT domain-containing protein
LRDIQGLLDGNTIFLEFSLGNSHSYLWLVTANSLDAYELPGRPVIQAAAKKLHEAWTRNEPATGRELSDLLLGGVAGKLANKRIVVAAEGALEYIPFAALPVPGGKAGLLIDSHEIVNVPSASAMFVLRRDAAGRKRAPNTLAIFADPVFSAQDLRMPALTRDAAAGTFDRLPGTRREAQQIAALAGTARTFQAMDFEASRTAALSPQLASYRIIHFATHGILDSRHPELSGLVFSMVDRKGAPLNGFVGTNDIYNMRLHADLVVLSACETALGAEIAGEGLVGLTRGFMYAGSPRVVASLWRVPDLATAELMRQFYEGMLNRGVAPAAALRQAALALRQQPKWASPYYWAAFTLQGEWN